MPKAGTRLIVCMITDLTVMKLSTVRDDRMPKLDGAEKPPTRGDDRLASAGREIQLALANS
jgi:hypothetical protein